jgi:peptide/nickel transport system permease protein
LTAFLLRRLGASLLLLLLVLTFLFFFLRLLPGDPIRSMPEGRNLTAEQRRNLERLYGFDRPLPEQYLIWISSVARGNWGTSLSQQRAVSTAIREVLPATVLLASVALGVELAASLLLGVLAARRRDSALDHTIRVVTLLLYSQPLFWLGLMAILLFSYVWPVLPASHMRSVDAEFMSPWDRSLDLMRHLVLPALVMGLGAMGSTTRFVRGSLIEVMGQDYIRTARAKGLSERRVVWVHAMRNALVPVAQVIALSLPLLLSGSLIVEVVFSWPGLGRLAFQAILTRDYPLILGTTALSAALVVLGNFVADVLQALIDPRVRDA